MQKIKANGNFWLSLITAAFVGCVIAYLVFVGKGFDPYDLDRPEQSLGYAKSYLYALYAAGLFPWVLLALTGAFDKPVSNRFWIFLSALGFVSVMTAAYLIMRLDDPNTDSFATDLPFTIQTVEPGSTEQELLDNLGEPISRTLKAPRYGEREFAYHYDGLYVHVTDDKVFGLWLTGRPFKYDNGIAIGMTRTEVERVLGESPREKLQHIELWLGDSDCFANLAFSEDRLERVLQACDD